MNIYFPGLLFFIYVLVPDQPYNLSIADFLREQCAHGDEVACRRFKSMEKEQKRALEMESRAEMFSRGLADGRFEKNNKPDLEAAYPLVMADYFDFEAGAGNESVPPDEERLKICARHYHNYWVNRKLWWPTTEGGKPDWAGIYIYIVDHYFGYCLRHY